MIFFKRLRLSIAVFTAIYTSAFSQGYKIKVKVAGLKDTVCYLAHYYGDKQYLDDTAKVDSKGAFTFQGEKPLPGGMYLVVLPGKRYFDFMVNEQNFSMETDTLDYVGHMKVKNTVENKLYFDYQKYIQPRGVKMDSLRGALKNAKTHDDSTAINEQGEKLSNEILAYRDKVVKENSNTLVATYFKAMTIIEPSKEEEEVAKAKGEKDFRFNFYKKHYWDNIDFSDGRLTRTPIYHQKLKEYISNLTYPTVDSLNKACSFLIEKSRANKEDMFKYTLGFLTNYYETSNLMGADGVYVYLVKKYFETKQAFWIDSATTKKIVDRANLLEPLLIGKKAPQLILADSNNQYYALHNVKAKYTVVIFWDPNCGHCQKEVPKLYNLYKKYKSEGLQVFAVDNSYDKKRWVDYIKKQDLQWINVCDPDHRYSFRQLYDIYSNPVIYLLNEKKEIIAKRMGVEQLEEILGNMLKYDKEKVEAK